MMSITRQPMRRPKMRRRRKMKGAKWYPLLRSSRGGVLELRDTLPLEKLLNLLKQWGREGCPGTIEWAAWMPLAPSNRAWRIDPSLEVSFEIAKVRGARKKDGKKEKKKRGKATQAADNVYEKLERLQLVVPAAECGEGSQTLVPIDRSNPWKAMVEWLTGEKLGPVYEEIRDQAIQRVKVPEWYELALKVEKSLKWLKQLSAHHEPSRLMPQVEQVSQEIDVLACEFAISFNWKDIHRRQPDVKRWIDRSLDWVRQRISPIRRNMEIVIPTFLTTWIYQPVLRKESNQELLQWIAEERWERFHYFFEAWDASSGKQQQRLVANQSLLRHLPLRLWDRMATLPRISENARKRIQKGEWYEVSALRVESRFTLELNNHTELSSHDLPNEQNLHCLYADWLQWNKQWKRRPWSESQLSKWRELLVMVTALVRLDPSLKKSWKNWLYSTACEASRNLKEVPRYRKDSMGLSRLPEEAEAMSEFWRMVVYRKVARFESDEPRKVRKMLDHRKILADELRYLEAREGEGTLTERSRLRLEYLRNNPPTRMLRQSKLRAQLQAAGLIAAQSAVERWIDVQVQRFIRSECPWVRSLDPVKLAEFLKFLGSVAPSSRAMLLKGLQQDGFSGHGYSLTGRINEAWLSQAIQSGLRLDAWLEFPKESIELSVGSSAGYRKKRFTLMISRNPCHVLWMGRPFDSCLDLRGGLYSASVVANWMDANKALLVVLDDQGAMVARKLLALTNQVGLLGYRIYSSLQLEGEDAITPLQVAIEKYCGRFAEAVGARLTNEGTPEKLHGTQWYNDGTVAWTVDGCTA